MRRSRKPSYTKHKSSYESSGVPAWIVFLSAIALVFGGYYLWTGLSGFIDTGGLGVQEVTQQAEQEASATADTRTFSVPQSAFTAMPSSTPLPECQDFRVIAQPSAVLRSAPTTTSSPLQSISNGEIICVLQRQADSEWYLVDINPVTRRIEAGYIRDDLVESANPTSTPSQTNTPAPTVTLTPSLTPSDTPPPTATYTPNPAVSPTPSITPTPLPTATPAVRSL